MTTLASIRHANSLRVNAGLDSCSAFISGEGKLYCNYYYEALNKRALLPLFESEAVVAVSCGYGDVLFRTESGKIYTIDCFNLRHRAIPVEVVFEEEIASIASGGFYHIVITTGGKMYSWNHESRTPIPIPFDVQIKAVSCAYFSAVVLSVEGKLYECDGEFKTEPKPLLLQTSEREVVKDIKLFSCGKGFTAFVTITNCVYMYTGSVAVPILVQLRSNESIISISCGNDREMIQPTRIYILTSNGRVFSFIREAHKKKKNKFNELYLPFRVLAISCSSGIYRGALLAEDGLCYYFLYGAPKLMMAGT